MLIVVVVAAGTAMMMTSRFFNFHIQSFVYIFVTPVQAECLTCLAFFPVIAKGVVSTEYDT
jgi:hypothetical protein